MTDTELRLEGVKALVAALGDVQAKRFVSLLTSEPFDHTKWQANLWPEASVDQLSEQAMQLRSARLPVE